MGTQVVEGPGTTQIGPHRQPARAPAPRRAATAERAAALTILVPAYNEAASIADTIHSLQQQTVAVGEIVIVDDCSTDETAAIARRCGVRVLTPPQNTGSKAGAQNFALDQVRTEFTMAIDADTTLAPDAIERLLSVFHDPAVSAACGFVIPRHVHSVWERGRYVEYLYAFTFYKQVQDYYGKPLIASGCFSAYRTEVLRAHGGWNTRTLAEDMDLTWSLYESGHQVRFVPDAVCYPIEPHDWKFISTQLRRWSHGFVQNVSVHWRGLLDVRFLGSAVAVSLWDATVATLIYLVLLPVLAIATADPRWLLGYVLDVPVLLIPVLMAAIPRGEGWRAVASMPAFVVLRTVNAIFFLRALVAEWVMRRPFRTYEKGH
jgi:poly-beta-1,6-N-acetyl-D-glucosamine synthase